MEERTPDTSYVEMTELVIPENINPLGSVLGGYVLHLIDTAGAISASRFCSNTVVTASIDSVDFKHPVRVGEVLNLKGRVNWAGTTSMEVGVDVYSENLNSGRRNLTCTAFLTFVAVDKDLNKVNVPRLITTTEEEKRCYKEAEKRRKVRIARLNSQQ